VALVPREFGTQPVAKSRERSAKFIRDVGKATRLGVGRDLLQRHGTAVHTGTLGITLFRLWDENRSIDNLAYTDETMIIDSFSPSGSCSSATGSGTLLPAKVRLGLISTFSRTPPGLNLQIKSNECWSI
jgi:hypothetical protein